MTTLQSRPRITAPGRRGEVAVSLSPERPVRERRLLLLLASIWLISAFDLGFTLVARALGMLVELNPIADWLMWHHGDLAVTAYKVALLGTGTVILWWYRRHRSAETAAWLILVVHVFLSVHWYAYYHSEDASNCYPDALFPTFAFRTIAPATPAVPGPLDQTRTDDARSEAADAGIRLSVAPLQ